MIRRLAAGICICACILGVSACARAPGFPPSSDVSPELPVPANATLPHEHPYLGVYERGTASSYSPVGVFASATGIWPDVIIDYTDWKVPFNSVLAHKALEHEAKLLVQMQPTGISIEAIAAGRYDKYLRSYADQVRAFGHPVIIGFAHEMNGTWYTWGTGHVSPSVWVAAWRHVVTVFRRQGARNVTWLWTIHHTRNVAALKAYWPGGPYVNWVGIDGYMQTAGSSVANVFSNCVDAVRKITPKPILLSEVGVSPSSKHQARDIFGLFSAVVRDQLLGLVWFDVAQHAPGESDDWRLEGNPAALAAFRRGVKLVTGKT
jgi:hypothetical protein